MSLCPRENATIYPLIWITQGTWKPSPCLRVRPAGSARNMWLPAFWRQIREKVLDRSSGRRSGTNCPISSCRRKPRSRMEQTAMFSCPISPAALFMHWRNCNHVSSLSCRRLIVTQENTPTWLTFLRPLYKKE
ncbi:hypothetical protein Clo1100_3429 [Clostridium sp. BNL1100]|nr:hypothetical protein Clo1100_3429 [Clostridium sp. BNL1100]